jgi:transitional endoplasmic reticulum ATPase
VSQLRTELDTLDEYSEVTVLGATNRPDLVDPALLSPRRFAYVVELPMPDEVARREILAAQTRKMPLAEGVDLDMLAKLSEGMSGADLTSLCQRAALNAIRHVIEGERRTGSATELSAAGLRVSMRVFEEALAEVRHGVSTRGSKNGTADSHAAPAASPMARSV